MDVGVQNTLRHLEWENRRLRSLLKAAGLPQIWMDAYLKIEDDDKPDGSLPLQGDSLSTAGPLVVPSDAQSANESKQKHQFVIWLLTSTTAARDVIYYDRRRE